MKQYMSWILVVLILFLCGCGESNSSNVESTGKALMEFYAPQETFYPAEATEAPSYKKVTKNGLLEYEVKDSEVRILSVLKDDLEIVIPETIDGYPVTMIGDTAFYQKFKCSSVELPQTLRTIESGAFYRCYSLEKIEIPASVTFIADDAFFRAASLEYIHIQEGNSEYCDIDGVLLSADGTVFLVYPEGRLREEYTIPDSVTTIASAAFGYYPAVQRLTIPSSVVVLPDFPFAVFEEAITIITEPGSAAERYALTWNIPCKTNGI